jgi:hypothetical protein
MLVALFRLQRTGKHESGVVAVLFTIYLLIVVALPLTLGIVVTYRGMTRERTCPLCGQETLRIHSRFTRTIKFLWRNGALQRRWCALCRWEGFARVGVEPAFAEVSVAPTSVPKQGCRTEALRMLRFGGNQWRVLLQCWQERGWHFGRLIFVGPAGRLWLDPMQPFAGATRNDVLQQALSLSDGLLTYRLREVASE